MKRYTKRWKMVEDGVTFYWYTNDFVADEDLGVTYAGRYDKLNNVIIDDPEPYVVVENWDKQRAK